MKGSQFLKEKIKHRHAQGPVRGQLAYKLIVLRRKAPDTKLLKAALEGLATFRSLDDGQPGSKRPIGQQNRLRRIQRRVEYVRERFQKQRC